MSALLAALDVVARVFGAKDESRSAASEFGPPPAAIYARDLAGYSVEYVTLAERDEIIARAQADAAARLVRRMENSR